MGGLASGKQTLPQGIQPASHPDGDPSSELACLPPSHSHPIWCSASMKNRRKQCSRILRRLTWEEGAVCAEHVPHEKQAQLHPRPGVPSPRHPHFQSALAGSQSEMFFLLHPSTPRAGNADLTKPRLRIPQVVTKGT